MSKHPLIRPPAGARNVERLTDEGQWVIDDRRPGRAFSGQEKDGTAYAWYACECSILDDNCPGNLAVYRTMERFGYANGCRNIEPFRLIQGEKQ